MRAPQLTSPTPIRRATGALTAVVLALLVLSGCSLPGTKHAAAPTATATKSPVQLFPSQFTEDGTFQSHINRNNLDFVYTLFANKATPRTNLWFARGSKYFSFSLTVYDLDRGLRSPFATKRKVWLSHIRATSTTVRPGHGSQSPYHLDAVARRITFDPQPLSNGYGMLITSPKGAFELRNQRIGSMAVGTRGVTLHFTATVHVQVSPGSTHYRTMTISQSVPITIFPGTARTAVKHIPIDAN